MIKEIFAIAFAIISVIFTFTPESIFEKVAWVSQEFLNQYHCMAGFEAKEMNVIISKLACFVLVLIFTFCVYSIFRGLRKRITIKGKNYLIQVEYGDILKTKKCKRIINFDECYTTSVGNAIADIKPNSICGQYLSTHTDLNIQQLIELAKVKPSLSKSKYSKKTRYDSGTIVPNGDDLLMAFAKLDEKGKGRFFSRDEYLLCLDKLWKEIENYYGQTDVCVPVLGAGITAFDDGSGASISQQDLLDMMIWSYRLSSHKIKVPYKLRIICKKNPDFSINRVES